MRIPGWLITIGWIALALLLWTTAGAVYLPTPLAVLQALPRLWSTDGLGTHLWESLWLNFTAAGIMFLVCLLIAYSTRMPQPLGRLFSPLAQLVSLGRFNGMVGLPLIFMSLLHNPHWVKVALLVFGAGVFTLLSLTDMIKSIPGERFDDARTLRMNEWEVLWEIVVLGSFDQVIDIMRVNLAMMWMMLPLVEGYFQYAGGVGTLLLIDNKHLELDKVICLLGVIATVGWLLDTALRCTKSLVCPHSELGLEKIR